MVSISAASTSALRVLQSTNRDMSDVQNRISTGKAISSAADNPAMWSIAQGLKADNSTNNAIMDGLKSTKAQADITGASLDQVSQILVDMKEKMTLAASGGNKADLQVEIGELQNQLKSVVAGASMGGKNWLDGSATSASIVSSISKSSAGAVSVNTMDVDLTNTGLIDGAAGGILDKVGTASTSSVLAFDVTTGDIGNMLTDLETAISSVSKGAAAIGSASKRIEGQNDFMTQMNDIRSSAISQITDADMEEEVTKLKALEVQQQLSTQALSIANSQSATVLQLFR